MAPATTFVRTLSLPLPMDSALTLRRIIDALNRLALMAHPGEYQQLRILERVYRTCLDRPVDPGMEEHAAFLGKLELQWLIEYQRDQDRFLQGTGMPNTGTGAPGCAERMNALLGENADVAWNGAIVIGALHGVHCVLDDGRWTIKCRDPCVASKPNMDWTFVRRGAVVPTPVFDESEGWPETSHPLDEDGRAASSVATPASESDSESELGADEAGQFGKQWWYL